ncbi:MAG: SurA N-terminal domain-containing protein [Ignavibacteria bacterium]
MFEYVRNNPKLVQLFLALITLPFAFWGVESYVRNAGSGEDAATVGGSKITMQEFQRALREQQERLRPALGGRDPAILDSPELRRSVIEGLVNQRLMAVHATKAKLVVSDDQLKQFIMSAPSLQVNGKFSPERYEMLVSQQGLSKEGFEARVRQDVAAQEAVGAIADAALPGRTAADRWISAQLEEREISEALLRPELYAGKVKLAPDAVKNYYEANRKQFELPEQVRAEFVVLSLDNVMRGVRVSPEEVRKVYDAAGGEKRAEEAKKKAESILAEVRKDPKRFADVARKYSEDPGSKDKGGDLGYFGRGMMVKPFEDAVFKMKVGDISGLVESDFGFHIIMLTGVRPGAHGEERQASHILIAKPAGAKSFESARGEIEAALRRDAAAKQFSELAEGFTNTVYEQSDSLKPAAEKYKLPIQTYDGWISKGGQALPPFANPKLNAAIFSEDAVKNKRNTEAIEVAPNTLVAAHVVEYKPASVQPLEAVAPAIEKALVRQEAAKLAVKDGEEKLAQLAKGEKVDLGWGAARVVARAYAPNMTPDAVRAVFSADAAHLPAYAGAAAPEGFALYRISQVKPYAAPAGAEEPPRAKALRDRYRQTVAEAELAAWLATLRQRYGVEINKAVFEPGGGK